jgi:hypothetical protein
MKRLFHVGAFVLVTGTFIACSKSSNDISAPGADQQRMSRSRDAANPSEMWTKILPEILEPRATALGNPDSYLFDGDQAVFFVMISAETTSDSFSGSIILRDEATGNVLQSFNMLPDTDPLAAGLIVPETITQNGMRYLFVQVPIDASYAGVSVAIETTVQQPTGETSTATLPAAFIGQL